MKPYHFASIIIIGLVVFSGCVKEQDEPFEEFAKEPDEVLDQQNHQPEEEINRDPGIFDYRFVKEKKVTGEPPFLTGYYPDIECVENNLYVSFQSNENKHVILLDEDLNPQGEPIPLLNGPDHEIVYHQDYFYFLVSQTQQRFDDTLVLVKYNKNFEEADSVYVLNADKEGEVGNDHFFSLCDGKLCIVTALPKALNPGQPHRSVLRIYDTDLNLLEKHVFDSLSGHAFKKGEYWVIIASKYFEQTKEMRLFAFFFDDNFGFSHEKQLTSEREFNDCCQHFPYGFEKVGDYYFVSHIATNAPGGKLPGGRIPGENYLSIFDENLDFVKKIKISEYKEDPFSIAFPRFCVSGDKLFSIYGVVTNKLERDTLQQIYVQVLKK